MRGAGLQLNQPKGGVENKQPPGECCWGATYTTGGTARGKGGSNVARSVWVRTYKNVLVNLATVQTITVVEYDDCPFSGFVGWVIWAWFEGVDGDEGIALCRCESEDEVEQVLGKLTTLLDATSLK